MSIIGYCRVSSKKQLEGNGLEAQKSEILSKYENAEIIFEQFSGKTTERPVFTKIINELKENDMLVVSKLDRLARNTVEGINIVQDLFKRNVSIHVLNVGLLENTSMGKFFLTTLLAMAEMERNTIIERMNAGKEIAKQNPNFKEGRPKKYTKHQLDWAMNLLGTNSFKQVSRQTGISESTLKRESKRRKENV